MMKRKATLFVSPSHFPFYYILLFVLYHIHTSIYFSPSAMHNFDNKNIKLNPTCKKLPCSCQTYPASQVYLVQGSTLFVLCLSSVVGTSCVLFELTQPTYSLRGRRKGRTRRKGKRRRKKKKRKRRGGKRLSKATAWKNPESQSLLWLWIQLLALS